MRNDLNQILQEADYEAFEQGKIISQWPRLRPKVGLIVKGTVSCYVQGLNQGKSILSHFLFGDDWIGLEHLPSVQCENRALVWRAETKCLISFFSQKKMMEMLDNPLYGAAIYRSMLLSISHQTGQVSEGLMAHGLPEQLRFEYTLSRVARVLGTPHEGGTRISSLSRVELARLAGVSREYASRQIKRLSTEGRLTTDGKGIILKTQSGAAHP